MKIKNEGAIKNEQSRDTDTIVIGHTRHRTKTNKTMQHHRKLKI
jgi:hypothetical protein